MKYFFVFFLLASCTMPNGQDPNTIPADRYEYELDIISDQAALCEGNFTMSERICESALEEFLLHLRKEKLSKYKKLRLFVYIKNATEDYRWAIAMFDRDIDLEFSVLTSDQIKELPNYSFPAEDADEVIGEWVSGELVLTIFRKNNQLKIRCSEFFREIMQEDNLVAEGDADYFDQEEPEVHYTIQENGNLRYYDDYEYGFADFNSEDPNEFTVIETMESFIKNNPYKPCIK